VSRRQREARQRCSRVVQLQQSAATQAAQHATNTPEIAALKQELAADKGHVSRLQDAITYTVNSDVVFRSGSWEMAKPGQEVIATLAPRLAPLQPSKIVVNGSTENAPVGRALQRKGVPSNAVLAPKRAEAVMQSLRTQGVTPEMIAARGVGEADPLASNATAEGRVQHRRVELTLTGHTAPSPSGRAASMADGARHRRLTGRTARGWVGVSAMASVSCRSSIPVPSRSVYVTVSCPTSTSSCWPR
jgi:outer membrane protein OmpA-like peptidoglycan-associated protein